VKVKLLAADLDELTRAGTTVEAAFERGTAALGSRSIHDQPEESPGTEAAVEELIDIYAEAYAQMRLLEFAFTTKSRDYAQSKGRYDAVEDALFDARRYVVPELRKRLGEVRHREEELVQELASRGVPTDPIGPIVPPDRAQETTPRPGEGAIERYTLTPIAPKPSLLERLRGRHR
jgi:hypothetical protein